MTKQQLLRVGQVHISRSNLSLALADFFVIILLISVGLLTHDTNPLTTPTTTFITSLPYLVGWILGALLTGLYRSTRFPTLHHHLTLSGLTWITAAFIGAGLRATPIFPGDAPPIFILVMTGLGLIAITTWRLILHTLT